MRLARLLLVKLFYCCAVLLIVAPGISLAVPKLTVGVSILPEKYFVKRIAGDSVKVIVMVGQGSNPETYEPKPRQLAELERAQVYFLVGVPFENKWKKMFSEVNPAMKLVALNEATQSRNLDQIRSTDSASHSSMDTDHPAKDPHFWLNPNLVKQAALKIKNKFIELDPQQKQNYQDNYQKFITDLERLDATIKQQLAPLQQRTFMVVHPSWGYFADAYQLIQLPIEYEGKPPGARTMTMLTELARQQHIKVIFVQPQFSTRNATTFARSIGAKLVALDPLAEDYIANLYQVAALLGEALS